MSTPVEQIKERLGIADVVGTYVNLEKAGSSLKAKCPFHNERTPSFFVSPARGTYYCFGCGAKGDIFSFVEQFEGLDFIGALRVLANRAGVELKKIDPKVRSEYSRLYLLLEKATRFFERKLFENPPALEYAKKRGIKEVTIKNFRIGYATNNWRDLFDYLSSEGYSPEEMIRVGLIKRSDDNSRSPSQRFYDLFRGRLMFPILDPSSRVIAFSGRILPALDDGKTGKYINSPEGVLWNKSEALYGFDKAKLEIRKRDHAILVEGQMDLVMSHQAGDTNTVAVSGTALTGKHLEKIKRLSNNIVLFFDSDQAGKTASEKAIRSALLSGMNVKVASTKAGKDPAEIIATDEKIWKESLANSRHVIDFLTDEVMALADGRDRAIKVEKTILPLIALIPSEVEQSHFISSVAQKTGLREDPLWNVFKKIKIPSQSAGSESVKPKAVNNDLLRRTFALLLLIETGEKEKAEAFRTSLQNLVGEDFAKMLAKFSEEKDVLLTEAEAIYGDVDNGLKQSKEILNALEEENLSSKFASTLEKLAQAEKNKDSETQEKLLRECKDLSLRLETLKARRLKPEK